jgi:hypothetical protein
MKNFQATEKASSPLKRTSSTSKHEFFEDFFCGSFFLAWMRIRIHRQQNPDIKHYRYQCPGSGNLFRIPDKNFSIPDPGSKRFPDLGSPGSASKILSILTPKNCFQALGNLDPDLDFFTHSGSRDQKGTGSRIRIRNTDRHIIFFLLITFFEGDSW